MPEEGDAAVIPAAMERINEDVALTQPIAQQESTRSYFLAQTLESTKTVPIVSANLPLDTSMVGEPIESATESEDSGDATEEGGEDSDESDLPASNAIAADSTVIGSFEHLGMTFAVEPGGESVALVASDQSKLPHAYLEAGIIVVPDTVTADGIDYYSVTRIADYAFASLDASLSETDASAEDHNQSDSHDHAIETVVVPTSVSSIDDAAFAGSDTLQYVVVEEGNPNFASYDGALYSADLTNLRSIPGGRVGAVRVAPSATDVAPEAFSHCASITTLVADPASAIWQKLQESELRNANGETIELIEPAEAETRAITESYEVEKETINALRNRVFTESTFTPIFSAFNGDDMSGLALEERAVSSSTIHSKEISNVELVLSCYNNSGTGTIFLAGKITSGTIKEMEYIEKTGTYSRTVIGVNIQGFKPYKTGDYIQTLGKAATTDYDWDTVSPKLKTWNGGTLPTNMYDGNTSISRDMFRGMLEGSISGGTVRFLPENLSKYEINWNTGTGVISNRGGNLYSCDSYAYSGYLDANHGLFSDAGRSAIIPVWAEKTGVKWENTISASQFPTRLGYKFDKFEYSTGGDFDPTAKVPSNMNNGFKALAKYTPNIYTITLNKNNGTGGTDSVFEKYDTGWYSDSVATISLTQIAAPTRPGWTFKGYSTSSSATTGTYWTTLNATTNAATGNPGTNAFSSHTTLYAVWSANPTYTISYEMNGHGTKPTSPASYIQGVGATLPTLSDDGGWEFGGWYSESSLTNKVTSVSTTDSGNKTFYAKWTPFTYTITWVMNNSSASAPTKTSYTYGTAWTLPAVSTYKDKGKKDLVGWYTDSALTTAASNITATTSGNKTFYAKWTDATYTITWVMNNSSASAPTKTSYTYGTAWTLPAVSTYKDKGNKDLVGWYTDSALTTAASNITSTTSGNKTFYAKWTTATYTITWVMNNSSATAPSRTTYTYGEEYALPAVSTYKDKGNKDLVGWYTNSACTTAASNITSTTSGNKTFYAKWTDATYTITWVMNNSSASAPTKTSYTYGTAYDLPAVSTYKDKGNKDLVGWYTNSALTTAASNITTTTSGNKTFYAKWTTATYTITWVMSNSSATAPSRTTYTYGEEYALPAITDYKDKDHKDLVGWYTNSDLTTKASDITKTTSGNKTFYAKWTAATYTITWYMKDHGLSQKPSRTTYTYGEEYALPQLSDDGGWGFGGWYADNNCATKAGNITKTTSGNKSYYAKWSEKTYTIEYVMNNHGTAPTTLPSWKYGTAPRLPDPAKVEGYTFGGWYWNQGCSDGQEASITATTTGPITVYAKWTLNKWKVSWNFDGAENKTNYTDQNVAYSSTFTLVDPGSKAGYKFTGWKATDADTNTYDKGYSYTMPDGDVTFTAQWSKHPYTTVNLSDPYLSEPAAQGAIYYWPEKGYVQSENSTEVKTTGIVTPPNLARLGYEFKGWYDVEAQNGGQLMIDSNGDMVKSGAPSANTDDGAIVWYAHWERVACPVNLAASYEPSEGETAFAVTDAGNPTSIALARFGVGFNDSTAKLASTPKRVGYAFKGYYLDKYPEMTKQDVEDGKLKGTCWIDEDGYLSSETWLDIAEKRQPVTLYAAWVLDQCEVTFDPTGNVNGAELNKEQVTVVSAPAGKTWYYGKPKDAMTVASEQTFYRNGYDFAGWFYTKDGTLTGEKVFVSDKQGNPTPANWMVEKKDKITLYPYWTAKSYTLVFDDNLPKIAGLETQTSATPEKKRTVEYDAALDLSDLKPKFDPYVFTGWYTKTDQLFEATHMTDNGDGTKRFTPRGRYVEQSDPSEIELHGTWKEPGESNYTLFWKIPGESEIKESLHKYYFTDTVQFNGTEAPVAPMNSGWRFEGWVEVDSYQIAHDLLATDAPYMEGDTIDGFKPISNWDRFFVAKWNKRAFSVSFSTAYTEAAEDGTSWLMPTDLLENWKDAEGNEGTDLTWEAACKLASQKDSDMSTGITYDVDMPAFVLPDVKRRGQVFEGWKLLDENGAPAGEAKRGIVIEPSKQDAQGMRDLVYVPVFKDAYYSIVLEANVFGEEQRFEGDRAVPYSGEFTFPYPATLSTGSVFECWAADTNTVSSGTYKAYPDSEPVKLAPVYDEMGQMTEFGLALLADEHNVITLHAVWNNANYHVDVPLFANLAIDTERGDVIAGTNTLQPDPENKDADAVYRVESIRYEPMRTNGNVAFKGAEDKVYLSVYAGLSLGEDSDEGHLLYAENVDEKTAELTYTDDKGETATATPLLIELGGESTVLYTRTAPSGQASLEGVTDASAPNGFLTFSAKSPLTVRYGLFFENPQTRKDFASNGKYDWLLPRNDGANKKMEPVDTHSEDYGRGNAWSGSTADIAKLHYTLSLVSETK